MNYPFVLVLVLVLVLGGAGVCEDEDENENKEETTASLARMLRHFNRSRSRIAKPNEPF